MREHKIPFRLAVRVIETRNATDYEEICVHGSDTRSYVQGSVVSIYAASLEQGYSQIATAKGD